MRDMVGRHGLLDHRPFAAFFLRLCLPELLLKLGYAAISQFARLLEFALALCDGKFIARLVKLPLQFGGEAQLFLFRSPRGRESGRLFLITGELFFEFFQPVPGSRVLFHLQRLTLDLQLHDAAVDLVQRLGFGIDLHSQPR